MKFVQSGTFASLLTAMYVAEFSFPSSMELATDFLICATSEHAAKQFADDYAIHWEMELFSLTPATAYQAQFYSRIGKSITVAV